MNVALLRALLMLRRIELGRALRRPTTYLYAATLVGVAVLVQHFVGLGAASHGSRPTDDASGLMLVAILAAAVVTAGLLGPVLRVAPREAQWIVTAPGGASALITWRLALSLIGPFVEFTSVIVAGQLLLARRVDPSAALILALWFSGFALTASAVRYGAASFFVRQQRPLVARLSVGVLLGAGCFALSAVPALSGAIGRPGAETGVIAYASALTWVGAGLALGLFALRHAERLVARAVVAGDPRVAPAGRTRLTPRTRTDEPDQFRLSGARALVWYQLLLRRRTAGRSLVMETFTAGAAAVLALTAPRWAPLAPALAALLILLASTGAPPPAPAGVDGQLLPLSIRSIASWRILLLSTSMLEFIGIPWLVCVVLGGGTSEVRAAGWVCLVPLAVFAATIRWLSLSHTARPDFGRVLRLLCLVVVTAALATGFLLPAPIGALAAAGLLVASTAALALWGVRSLERV